MQIKEIVLSGVHELKKKKMNAKELKKLGAEMGLAGGELLAFVKAQQEFELAKIREQKEYESMKLDKENEKLDKEKELQALRNEGRANDDLNSSHSTTTSYGNRMPTPKMPHYDEKEDLDAYILRFERFAKAQNWPNEDWALNLSLCLTGESLRVYSRLPPDDSMDYSKLKEALLKRFQLTEEGFRLKFRREKPKKGETSIQFMARLDNYLFRWLELGLVEKTHNGVIDLMLKEQFLNVCNKDISLFVKEHGYKSSQQLSELADKYLEAHASQPGLDNCVKVYNDKKGQTKKPEGNTNQNERRSDNYGPSRKSVITCFLCGKIGHKAYDCRQKNSVGATKANSAVIGEKQGGDKSQKDDAPKIDHHHGQAANACLIKQINESASHKINLACGHDIPIISAACKEPCDVTKNILDSTLDRMPVTEGYLGGKKVSVLRDSGCSGVIVKRALVPDNRLTGNNQLCVLIDGTVRNAPEALIEVNTPFYTGSLKALCMKKPLYDLIIGNVVGVRDPGDPDSGWTTESTETHCVEHKETIHVDRDSSKLNEENNSDKEIKLEGSNTDMEPQTTTIDSNLGGAVETRAQNQKKTEKFRPLHTASVPIADITREQLIKSQREDTTLKHCWSIIGETKPYKGNQTFKFVNKRSILYRRVEGTNKTINQLCVPSEYRDQVMKLAHDSIMAGHLGIAKTIDKVLSQFYWPGVTADVSRYCKSCDICQRTCSKGRVTKVPLGHMPLIDTPFKRVAVDIVGPISPISDKGNRYILTLVDYATRFPEAVALPIIDTERVAEALVGIFSRVGVPSEILTDRGTQFTSGLMKEISRLLSLKQLTTTPYHPICNGLVEKFNGTLKRMLKRMCEERPVDWDRYIGPLLFAYREAPQASTGFAPFELLYGRTVRGPMAILKEIWTSEVNDPEIRSTYQYVLDLRERLEHTCNLARMELEKSSERYRKYYNKGAKLRKLVPGDYVLILLPTDQNKLLMQWKGPFPILKKVGEASYSVDVNGNTKCFHANLLKKYISRELPKAVGASVLEIAQEEELESCFRIPQMNSLQTETKSDVMISEILKEGQSDEMEGLLNNFSDILTDVPGRTTAIECNIRLNTDKPIKTKPYPVPFAMRQSLQDEIQKMIDFGVVETSHSSYCAPVVLVPKPDGTKRFCVRL